MAEYPHLLRNDPASASAFPNACLPSFGIERLFDPLHGGVRRVLHLDPVRRGADAIGAVAMFRNQALEPELAGLAEQIRADIALLEGGDEDPIGAPCQQPGEIGFAQAQWQLAQPSPSSARQSNA